MPGPAIIPMKQHLFLRGLGALLVAGMGTMASAQDDEENNNGEQGERRPQIFFELG